MNLSIIDVAMNSLWPKEAIGGVNFLLGARESLILLVANILVKNHVPKGHSWL